MLRDETSDQRLDGRTPPNPPTPGNEWLDRMYFGPQVVDCVGHHRRARPDRSEDKGWKQGTLDLVEATGSALLELHGIGPSGAARLLGDIGDVARFPTRGHFASWNGTAPIDGSFGEQMRHRLSRAGNRRINRVLHIMAIVQLRNDTEGRAYYRRKLAAGKTAMEAIRALKRRLSDVVYRQLVNDQKRLRQTVAVTGPGGQAGAATDSSAADSNHNVGASEKSLPGPAAATLRPPTSGTPTSGTARPSFGPFPTPCHRADPQPGQAAAGRGQPAPGAVVVSAGDRGTLRSGLSPSTPGCA